jgi:hypothetical protein
MTIFLSDSLPQDESPCLLEASKSSLFCRRQGSADLRRSRVCRLAAMSAGDLPLVESAFPGPLRDQLVAAILAGEKTTTTGLVAD